MPATEPADAESDRHLMTPSGLEASTSALRETAPRDLLRGGHMRSELRIALTTRRSFRRPFVKTRRVELVRATNVHPALCSAVGFRIPDGPRDALHELRRCMAGGQVYSANVLVQGDADAAVDVRILGHDNDSWHA